MYKDKKIAFVFPGQGAQYIGMAQDYLENNAQLKTVLQDFDSSHSTSLESVMSNGPEDELKKTKLTQPAILFHSIAALQTTINRNIGLKADFCAGHSLGEYSALVSAGVLTLADAMHLVHKRGEFMMSAGGDLPFAMSAIVGLAPKKVKDICVQASKVDIVVAANYNTPVQTVISGSKKGVKKAGEVAKEKGAKMVVPLVVGGAFHSPIVAKAGDMLAEELRDIKFSSPKIPIVSNVDAKPTTEIDKIKNNLKIQVSSSVLWVDSIEYLLSQGVEIFIEFGPGRVVSGMIKKINRKVKIFNVDKFSDIKKLELNLKKIG